MRRNDPNLAQLRAIAEALGDLCEQVVFVGGATAGLLLTDPLAESVRPTVDVDAIVEASGLTPAEVLAISLPAMIWKTC